MKNSVKLFGLLVVSLFVFSCSTDEQDADLERAINMSETIYQKQAIDSTKVTDSTSVINFKEDGNPIVIGKKD